MAAQSSSLASFSWGGVAIGDVAAIGSVTLDGAIIDVTEISTDAFRQFISGKYQMNFSIELFYNHTAHSALTTDFLARNAAAFVIDFGDGQVSGTAILTNVSMSSAVDDASRLSVSAQCTGAVTIVP